MSKHLAIAFLSTLLFTPLSQGVTSYPNVSTPQLGVIEKIDPSASQLFPDGAKIEVLAGGATWAEGPVWMKDPENPAKGKLVFSDVPQNKIYEWSEGQRGLKIFLQPSGFTGPGVYSKESGSNGLTVDAKGQLLACEHGDRRISLLPKSGGGKLTLADRFEGKRFNSPNDLCVHSGGAIYFTDPPYGLVDGPDSKSRELSFFGVFRIATDGKVTAVIKDLTRPNGIAFSPDEKILYIAQSDPAKPVVMAYPMKEDGTVGEGTVFWDAKPHMAANAPGLPDGMKVDSEGRVWVTGPGGLWVLDPKGKELALLHTGVPTANCNWGEDGSTLYITADSWLCRVRTKVKGAGWK